MAHLDLLKTTAADLAELLAEGSVTSVELVTAYLRQIAKYNDYLCAVFQTAPKESLLRRAEKLDAERASGIIRSDLHGIPILIKDSIATHPELQMRTTAGNWALAMSVPRDNAGVVDKLLDAGLIILGKASMSELSHCKGFQVPFGWSAIGGQTQSPFVRGGYKALEGILGLSNCGGSSSGSAVSVAMGFSPVSLGVEAQGSLAVPATRAGLYSIKPTVGIVPHTGIVAVYPPVESVGPMAKSVTDLAMLLDVIVDPARTTPPKNGYKSALTQSFAGLRIATVPECEHWPYQFCVPNKSATRQIHRETIAAYDKISTHTSNILKDVKLPSLRELKYEGRDALNILSCAGVEDSLNLYLQDLAYSPVRSLKELVDWNVSNADLELPDGPNSQIALTNALDFKLSKELYKKVYKHAVTWGQRIDEIFDEGDVNVIIGPGESRLFPVLSAATGYPLATLPLGYLDLNGRPFGLMAIARQNDERTLLMLQSAWEAIIRPPTAPVIDLLSQ